jgi:8-oxo-dGTP diphosphatase
MARTRKKRFCYEYPRPAVTVDTVVVTRERRPRVLLVRRKHDPFAGMWALPGGFVDQAEGLETAARRELAEETGVRVVKMEQLQSFGDPGRDPRGPTISVVFLARVSTPVRDPEGGDDAAEARWHPLHRLPPLAFDHAKILAFARARLRKKRRSVRKS